ncbi:unnamed protein product [Clonostachys rhizophaga]|uniref:Uncharacterized protein n=1 Tax=Clonostachys rhizophaga TaxID=160324 RepID=A0A9N9VGU9_9HYPO|nr:unnamed protein product [Clonostachys rhizophaga]
MPPKGRRGPSGPWGRLKPVVQDPLESIGLPSKGDNRLLEFGTQEKYYTKIMERYMGFCSDAGKPDELLRRFSALEIGESAGPSASPTSTASTASSGAPPSPSLSLLQSPANTKGLSDVMMALRKLREGIVASKRVDDFAVQAYLFCVRLSVLVKHPESYHPAILYLLRALHPQQPLTSVELQEVVAYLVLDAACRRGQMSEAYSIRREYRLRDAKVDAVLDALAHDNYVRFRRLKQSVDGHRARIMDWAEGEVRMQTLKALGRAYLSIDLGFLESVTGAKWDDLKSNDGVGWELEGNKVVIKKIRASTHTVVATKLASFRVSLTYGESERMQCRLGSKPRDQRLVSRNSAAFLGGEKLLQLPEVLGHSFYTCPEINNGLDDEPYQTPDLLPFKQIPSSTLPNLYIT